MHLEPQERFLEPSASAIIKLLFWEYACGIHWTARKEVLQPSLEKNDRCSRRLLPLSWPIDRRRSRTLTRDAKQIFNHFNILRLYTHALCLRGEEGGGGGNTTRFLIQG